MNSALLALLLLLQTGSISGRVVVMDGTPAVRTRVVAQAVSETTEFAKAVETDEQGRYRLEGLGPGRFYIVAGLIDRPSYYPGVSSMADAQVVTVSGNAAVNGIDFKMSRPTPRTVRGRLTAEPGATIPPAARVLLSGSELSNGRNMVVRADGTFEFERVAPGNYKLSVLSIRVVPTQEIELTDKDVEIEWIVHQKVAVAGRLAVEGDGPMPRITVLLTGVTEVGSLLANPNGRFYTQLLPGTYRLSVNGVPPGYAVKSVIAGSMDWLKEDLVLEVGKAVPEFVVTLSH